MDRLRQLRIVALLLTTSVTALLARTELLGGTPASDRLLPVRGVSLAYLFRPGLGYGGDDCRKQLAAISAIGANWIQLTDIAYMPAIDKPELQFRTGSNTAQAIRDSHAAGLSVLLKPYIWSRQYVGGKKWQGDIAMTTDADWDTWFANYTAFILDQAKLAQAEKVECLSVGMETMGTTAQEGRWRKLIAEVRAVYHGKLTYASAYWVADKIRWWDALDWVGIDAYYGVTDKPSASAEELHLGWQQPYREIEALAKKTAKPVVFTEIGYTQSVWAGKNCSDFDVENPDPEYQAMLYKIALEEASKHDCMAGVFVWKWFTSDRWREDEPHEAFCVQDEPRTIAVLRSAWKR